MCCRANEDRTYRICCDLLLLVDLPVHQPGGLCKGLFCHCLRGTQKLALQHSHAPLPTGPGTDRTTLAYSHVIQWTESSFYTVCYVADACTILEANE